MVTAALVEVDLIEAIVDKENAVTIQQLLMTRISLTHTHLISEKFIPPRLRSESLFRVD